MKKLIILTSTLILLLAIAGTALATTQAISVSQVLGSSNTDAGGPVSYLSDGNQSTPWTISGKPSSAWAQLQLASPILIDGLQIYGPCSGKLTIQYWQNGSWHNFIAADHLKGETFGAGWNLLDLSYDRVVTNQIRLWLDNPQQLSQIGGIGEVKVLGRSSQDILERLDPVTVTSNRNSDSNHPVSYLFDHNTYSSWWMNGGTPASGEAVADLGEVCTIQRIKVFGGSDGSGQFKLQYLSGSNWLDIPGLTNLSISQIGAAWKSFNLPNGISTNQIKAVINSTQRVGGIREIEIWGRKATPTGSSYLDSNQTAVLLSSTTSANYTFNITNSLTTPAILHVVTEGSGTTPLTWELNGQTMGNLSPVGTIRGLTVYQQVISSNLLWSGVNFIQINGANLTVRDCKLEISGAHSLTFSGSLSDRWLLTSITGSEQIIELGGTYNIDDLVLSYLGSQLPAQIAIDQNGSWVTLTGIPTNNTGAVGGEMTLSYSGLIHRIKVDFNPGASGFTELTIHGSRVNDVAPQVKILSPINGTFYNLTTWGAGYITGTVDNPDATVRVNGQGMTLTGTSFNISLPVAGNPDSSKVIQVIATDSKGRTGSDQVTINISNPPDFTVNLADQLIYTKESQITVSGQVVVPQSKVTINDVAVTLNNLSFSKAVALNEGLNLITIKVMPPGNPQWATIQRRVIRTSNPPLLKVLAPVDGQIVKDSQITISGQVSSTTPTTVTVNGKAATVSSGYFSSSPLTLVEGANTITVIATDQNKLTSQTVLTIWRDQTAPVLSGITPADGAWFNTLTVTVTGTVSDANPVSVLVNGQAVTIAGGRFNTTIAVKEGANALNIQATDSAGNVTPINRTINIDTNSPLAFAPTTDISGWSNNNKPTVSFNTSDTESGIDHYEIAVDDDTYFKPGSSPYKFTTAIADGEHTIYVKAFDKAGNATIGTEVKVDIDTVSPELPQQFEVISGIGRVILKWQGEDPRGEIVGYRITRTPAFNSGSFKELTRALELADLSQFIDEEVTSGQSYSYSIQARDHAGNYSQTTTVLTTTVGITTQSVDNTGGTIKFDACQLIIAQEVIDTPGKIVIKAAPGDLPENGYAAKLGAAYSLTMLNQSGQEVPTEFKKPVTLVISYANMKMPEGFSPEDLGVYWYNQESGAWEKLDYAMYNIIDQTISVQLLHFSEYQVMASKYVSPSLDSYYNMGVSPFQSYFQDNTETVSPESGGLTVSATDLKLPGRSGNLFTIKRIYDTAAAEQEKYLEKNKETINVYPQSSYFQQHYHKAPIDTFGYGWSLNIPWIEGNDKGDFIRLPEGQTIKIELKNGAFVYHKGIHFTLSGYTKTTQSVVNNTTITSYYYIYTSLTFSDGTVYQFNELGQAIKQSDASDKNEIIYAYDARKVKSITDSVNRVINFHYKTVGSRELIDQISTGTRTGNIRTVSYSYDNDKGVLTDVNDPINRHTHYDYERHDFRTGIRQKNDDGDDDSVKYSVDFLKTLTYPTGAVSTYTYESRDQYYHEKVKEEALWGLERGNVFFTYYGTKVLISKRSLIVDNNDSSMDNVTNYTYVMNDRYGTFGNGTFFPAYSYMVSAQITEEGRGNKLELQQIRKGHFEIDLHSLTGYEGDLVTKSTTYIGPNRDQLVEDVINEYNIPLRAVTAEKHYRNDVIAYQITTEYDDWGNPTKQVDGSRDLLQSWSYYNEDTLPVKHLVASQTQSNENPVTNIPSVVTTSYTYDEKLFKPLSSTVNVNVSDHSRTG